MTAPVIIKVGGAMLDGDYSGLLGQIRRLRSHAPVIVVHGGGPQATRAARERGHEPVMVRGRRITTDRDLEIHLEVVCGAINRDLVERGRAAGIPMVSLPSHAGTVRVVKRPPWVIDGETVDFGHVGDVEAVDPAAVLARLQAGEVPVLTPSGSDSDGAVYNVNADTIALEVAAATSAAKLVFVTESGGVRGADGSDLSRMTAADVTRGIEEGWLRDGMIVKTNLAVQALERGVNPVWVTGPDELTDSTGGTVITA